MLIKLISIALLATLLAQVEWIASMGLSSLPIAILIGIVYGNLMGPKVSAHQTRTLKFCQQRLLRLGIILFGFNLSFQQIALVGWQAIIIDLVVVSLVLSIGILVGVRLLGLSREVAALISVGSAICGAAAIMASENVTRARQEDTTVSVATVVIFGTLAMFSYPVIYSFSDIEPAIFGIYIGSTVHEVAQAVAAGQSIGGEAMQSAVVTKLIRVMLLAPVVIFLGLILFRRDTPDDGGCRLSRTIPWFVLGFIGAVIINSLIALPVYSLQVIQYCAELFLATAMAAMGVNTQWSTVRKAGTGPLLLSSMLFAVLMVGGFGLNVWLH